MVGTVYSPHWRLRPMSVCEQHLGWQVLNLHRQQWLLLFNTSMFASFLRVRTRIIRLKNLNVFSQNLEEVKGGRIEIESIKTTWAVITLSFRLRPFTLCLRLLHMCLLISKNSPSSSLSSTSFLGILNVEIEENFSTDPLFFFMNNTSSSLFHCLQRNWNAYFERE